MTVSDTPAAQIAAIEGRVASVSGEIYRDTDYQTFHAFARRDLRFLLDRCEALGKEKEEAIDNGSTAWECLTMARETVGTILSAEPDYWEGIAPMFLPEAIRTACYRAATGKLRDEVTPSDASSRRVIELEAANTDLRARVAALSEDLDAIAESNVWHNGHHGWAVAGFGSSRFATMREALDTYRAARSAAPEDATEGR